MWLSHFRYMLVINTFTIMFFIHSLALAAIRILVPEQTNMTPSSMVAYLMGVTAGSAACKLFLLTRLRPRLSLSEDTICKITDSCSDRLFAMGSGDLSYALVSTLIDKHPTGIKITDGYTRKVIAINVLRGQIGLAKAKLRLKDEILDDPVALLASTELFKIGGK